MSFYIVTDHSNDHHKCNYYRMTSLQPRSAVNLCRWADSFMLLHDAHTLRWLFTSERTCLDVSNLSAKVSTLKFKQLSPWTLTLEFLVLANNLSIVDPSTNTTWLQNSWHFLCCSVHSFHLCVFLMFSLMISVRVRVSDDGLAVSLFCVGVLMSVSF